MENTAYPSPLASPPLGGGPGAEQRPPERPGAVAPPRALRARRRRPAVLALSVALIAAGGLGGAALYTATGQRVAVLALARDVPSGQRITADDLTVARIASDPVLRPVSADDLDRAVGRRATTDLKRGSLLTESDVANTLLVQPGQQIVGVAAKHTQLPATRLAPGRQVLIVATPGSGSQGQGGSSAGSISQPLRATVVTVGPADTDGTSVVDVAVDSDVGPRLAAVVASGNFLVILDPGPDTKATPSAAASEGSSG